MSQTGDNRGESLPREVVENKVWGSPLPPHMNPLDYAQQRPTVQEELDNVPEITLNNNSNTGGANDSMSTAQLRELGLMSSSSSASASASASADRSDSASAPAGDGEEEEEQQKQQKVRRDDDEAYAHPRNASMFALSDSTTQWELIRYNGYMVLILDRFILYCDRCDSGEFAQKRTFKKIIREFPIFFTSLRRLLLGDYLLRFCVEQRNVLDVVMDAGGARGYTLLMFFFATIYKVIACVIRLTFMKPESRALLCDWARIAVTKDIKDGEEADCAWALEEVALEELLCNAEGFFLAKVAHFPHVIRERGCIVPPQTPFSMLTQSQLYNSLMCLAYRWREVDYHEDFHRFLTCLFYRHAIITLEQHNSEVFDEPRWRMDLRTSDEVEDNEPIRYGCSEAYLWNTTAMLIDMFTDRFIAEGGYCATATFEDPLEVLGRLVCDMQIPDPDVSPTKYTEFKERLRKAVQLWFMREFVIGADSPEWRESVITAGWITGRRPGESAMFFRESRFVQMTRPETLWYETRMKIELDYRQYAKSVDKRPSEAMVDEKQVGRISAGIALHKAVMPALERDFSEKGNALERAFPIVWSWCVFLQMPVVQELTEGFFRSCALQIMGEFFLVSRNTLFRTRDLQTALFWWFMTSPRQDIQRRRDELRTFLMEQGFEFTATQRKCEGVRKRWNDQRLYRVCKSIDRYDMMQDWRRVAWLYWETNRFEVGVDETTNATTAATSNNDNAGAGATDKHAYKQKHKNKNNNKHKNKHKRKNKRK